MWLGERIFESNQLDLSAKESIEVPSRSLLTFANKLNFLANAIFAVHLVHHSKLKSIWTPDIVQKIDIFTLLRFFTTFVKHRWKSKLLQNFERPPSTKSKNKSLPRCPSPKETTWKKTSSPKTVGLGVASKLWGKLWKPIRDQIQPPLWCRHSAYIALKYHNSG